jgi:SnoaL-like domain
MRARRVTLAAAVVAAVALVVWWFRTPGDEASIRRRLQAFVDHVNRTSSGGPSTASHAAAIGSYFTEDVRVDLGQGSTPIDGRETVVGMATRLQPRIAAYRLKFDDISVQIAPDGASAEIHLAAEFIRRTVAAGEDWLDAREFTLAMRKVGDDWRIARVTAIDTLR